MTPQPTPRLPTSRTIAPRTIALVGLMGVGKSSIGKRLAGALEKDMNHYLTKVAKEYYPDTDRMLLMLGFSGISFKALAHTSAVIAGGSSV